MVKIQSKSKGLAKRIVPCLDVKNGETVKGTNFVNLRSAGDPVELGKAYSDAGADELVFLDITASFEERKTFTDMVTRVAAEINIPFTVEVESMNSKMLTACSTQEPTRLASTVLPSDIRSSSMKLPTIMAHRFAYAPLMHVSILTAGTVM